MLDEHQRPAKLAPQGDQPADVGLAFRVVAHAPVVRIVKGPLHINDDEGWLLEQVRHAPMIPLAPGM